MKRTFVCSEADYLTAHGIDLKHAVLFDARYGPAAVREMVEAGVSPEQANALHGLNATEVAQLYAKATTARAASNSAMQSARQAK